MMNKITAQIREKPDITLEELIKKFSLGISVSALCRKLNNLELTYKKRRCFQKTKSVRMLSDFAQNG